MAEQLGLFAPKRQVAPAGCARVPGPLCRDGREGRCPGGPRCEELGAQETERIHAAEAERAAGRSALPPPLVVEVLTPEDLSAPDLGVGPPDVGCRERTSLFHPTIAEATAAALSFACGACGSTTGAVLYERGPLAGLRRCWPCARPALEA
jgi:hypothetical protein